MANVLVTGGAGYVGGALTDKLVGSGHDVRVFDSLVYEESYRKPVPFVFGDVRDKDALRPHLDWADVVVWLAAMVGDPACQLDPERAVEVNRDTVANLARDFDGRIMFLSTCSVYGAAKGILTEDSPTRPLSVYAETKLEAEAILKDKNAITFRLGTLFGISDTYSRIRMDLVVNVLTARSFKRGHMTVFGGEQYRPLIHVRDVAGGVFQNIDTDLCGVFNLHQENMRISHLAEQIQAHFPGVKLEKTPMKFEDNRNYQVSSDRAVEAFGFSPELTLQDGIRELKELLEEGRIKELGIPRHSNFHFLKETYEQIRNGSVPEPWI